MRPWLLAPAALALALGAAACDDATAPLAMQIRVVIIDGTAYTTRAAMEAERPVVGERYAVVRRYVDCSGGVAADEHTHLSDYCPLRDGESNYLPAGTPIHRLEGVEPAVALAARHLEQWQILRPVDRREEDPWSP